MEKTIHALHHGLALCGFSRSAPAGWPEGHRWAPIRNIASVTCEGCKTVATSVARSEQAKPRFEEDDWQKRESEQQQLVEEIISSLHRLTGDNGENYPKVFGGIAQLIIWHIADDAPNADDNPINALASAEMLRALLLFRDKVGAPIDAFVGPDNEEERKFLLGVLLEKMIVTIRTPSSNAYNAKLMLERRM